MQVTLKLLAGHKWPVGCVLDAPEVVDLNNCKIADPNYNNFKPNFYQSFFNPKKYFLKFNWSKCTIYWWLR